ncbi:MAG: hypothetical protein RL235_882 [Chlamydiota bacterium]|jgi:hypothetical protein
MKKRTFTLLEIIIAIFLITLITGAIGYSMRGTLDKGRVFRTEQAKDQLHDLLLMCVAEGDSPQNVAAKPMEHIRKHKLAKHPDKIVLDGWGKPFHIQLSKDGRDFVITSDSE